MLIRASHGSIRAWVTHRWVALVVAAAFAVGLRKLFTKEARFAGDPEVRYRPQWFLARASGYWFLPAVFLIAAVWLGRATPSRERDVPARSA